MVSVLLGLLNMDKNMYASHFLQTPCIKRLAVASYYPSISAMLLRESFQLSKLLCIFCQIRAIHQEIHSTLHTFSLIHLLKCAKVRN